MNFRIANTFTDSLAWLTADEQKAIKTTAFDLQMNSANPGMQFHKLDKTKDRHFWSLRVNTDIRPGPSPAFYYFADRGMGTVRRKLPDGGWVTWNLDLPKVSTRV